VTLPVSAQATMYHNI